jgi:uncharacterized membrane protein YkvA (DUF1232 family)
VPVSITFELSDEDLEHFRTMMRQVRESTRDWSQEQVVNAARGLLEKARAANAPRFVLERLDRMGKMIAMLEDEEWALPENDRARVHNALAYFCEPCDLIPDHVVALGFLDDAIMIELVVEELRDELEAYEDFCRFREEEQARQASAGAARATVTRKDWLDAKRAELKERERNRGLRGLFSLFSG